MRPGSTPYQGTARSHDGPGPTCPGPEALATFSWPPGSLLDPDLAPGVRVAEWWESTLPPDILERPHVESKTPTENSRGGRLSAKKSLQVTTVTEQAPEGEGGPAPPGRAASKEQSLSSKKHRPQRMAARRGRLSSADRGLTVSVAQSCPTLRPHGL